MDARAALTNVMGYPAASFQLCSYPTILVLENPLLFIRLRSATPIWASCKAEILHVG